MLPLHYTFLWGGAEVIKRRVNFTFLPLPVVLTVGDSGMGRVVFAFQIRRVLLGL
jgi:hypothetical protein